MAHKVFRVGTHRVRQPERTWELIEPLLADYGITRVADVTGLDVLGVPVAMAMRPLARTLTVSQGKGQNLLLAKVSAAMESMEFWHAEFHHPPTAHRQVPARDLGLPYRIEQLSTGRDALVTEDTPMDWVDAIGLVSGATVPVPASLVTVPPHRRSWVPPGLLWSTNGLASGNSYQEACLHALYELIERDAVSTRISAATEYVEPASVADPSCAELIARITAAGATLRITRVSSRFDVPCFGATVWSPEFPLVCLGWGAHLDADVAVSRAVTEAAQSRLTTIAGSRDDIPSVYQAVRASTDEPAPVDGAVIAWREARDVGPGAFDDLTEELAWVCGKVNEVAGAEPLCVDLSTAAEFAVVKIVAPATTLDVERVHTSR
ncbi:MAG TPA: YcaO-like family protein [Pseudonocardiaceae bacterium]